MTILEGKKERYPDCWGPITLKKKEDPNKADDGFIVLGFGMIPWKHCLLIVKTAHIWVDELQKSVVGKRPHKILLNAKGEPAEDLKKCWEMLNTVWDMLHYTSKEVKTAEKGDFKKEKETFDNFGKLFLKVWAKKKTFSQYLHIVLCHTIQVCTFEGKRD